MILICYDGSDDAKAAIDRAGQALAPGPATVLTIWEPFVDTMASSGGGIAMASFPANVAEIDEVSEQAARERADEGVDLARRAGLTPQPRARQHTVTIADTILSEADDVGADLIVVGSRGLTGIKSLLLGSVSHALLQHTDRAVLVVPSAKVATERSKHRHSED